MNTNRAVPLLLAVIALLLGVIAFRPLLAPAPVRADATDAYDFYVEPGTTMLRKPDGTGQVLGKVMVNMRTGEIWGFPTKNSDPYPQDATKTTAPTSHPIYLGKYAFSEAQR